MESKIVSTLTVSPKLISLGKKTSQNSYFLKSLYISAPQAMKKKSRNNPFLSLFSHSSKMKIGRNIIPNFVYVSVQSGKQKLLNVFQQKGFNGAENSLHR